jgi:hypothetical protein
MPSPSCRFCGKPFPTRSGANRHIQRTTECRDQWRKRFGKYSINVFDIVDGTEDPPDGDSHATIHSDGENSAEADYQPMDNDLGTFDHDMVLDDSLEPNIPQPQSKRATVEDVDDGEDGEDSDEDQEDPMGRYIEEYPKEAFAGAVYGEAVPKFVKINQAQKDNKCAPFKDDEEWELAEWLLRNVGQTQTDAFLKLNIVSALLRKI